MRRSSREGIVIFFGGILVIFFATDAFGSSFQKEKISSVHCGFLFVSGRIESRFLDSSDPEKSVYFNPVTLTESGGAIKGLMKEDTREWTVRIGAGLREQIAREVFDPLNNSRSTKTSTDGGIEFVNDLRTPLADNRIHFQSELIVFKAFFNSKSKDLKGLPEENYRKSPDINWENIFTVSITKYLIVNLYTQLLYDKEIDKAGRFKQTLGL